MKKLGRLLALVLCLITFAMLVLGSGSEEVDKVISDVENAVKTEGKPGNKDTDTKTESAKTEGSKTEDAKTEGADAEAPGKTPEEVTLEETVLLDKDGLKITATGLESGWLGTELKMLIENGTDTNLTIQVRDVSVNGFMADPMMSEDVAAGKKSNSSLIFSNSALEKSGIETIATIEFSFHIFTSDGWDDYLDTDAITVKTSAAATYTQPIDDSGEVIYEKDGIKIVGKGLSAKDSIFGPGLILYIENNTTTNFTVQAKDTSVNGFMIDSLMSEEVVAGKKAITAVTFFDSSLEENGISDIESIEAAFHIFSTKGWNTIVDIDPVKINFK